MVQGTSYSTHNGIGHDLGLYITEVALHPVARSPSTLEFSQKQEIWRRRKI